MVTSLAESKLSGVTVIVLSEIPNAESTSSISALTLPAFEFATDASRAPTKRLVLAVPVIDCARESSIMPNAIKKIAGQTNANSTDVTPFRGRRRFGRWIIRLDFVLVNLVFILVN